MFALKGVLKNVQRMDIIPAYVKKVIIDKAGKEAMKLACQVALDQYLGTSIDYLETSSCLIDNTNICFSGGDSFCRILKDYTMNNEDILSKTEEQSEKDTRSQLFSINDAKVACDLYVPHIQILVTPLVPLQKLQQKTFLVFMAE